MNLHEMPSLIKRTKKRVGRGTSSGRGKTSGRGHKGDKARGKSPWYRVGGSRRSRLIKHLPQRRGIGNGNVSLKAVVVTLAQIEASYNKGETVSLDTLIEKGLVSRTVTVKVLNKGSLKKAVTVRIPVSLSAKEAIERAGGTIESK
jgi:large subunit ribosomal protein L15